MKMAIVLALFFAFSGCAELTTPRGVDVTNISRDPRIIALFYKENPKLSADQRMIVKSMGAPAKINDYDSLKQWVYEVGHFIGDSDQIVYDPVAFYYFNDAGKLVNQQSFEP